MDDWPQQRSLVLQKLDEHEQDGNNLWKAVRDINISMTKLTAEVAKLGVKAGVWGALGGLIPATVVFIYFISKGAGQ